MTLRKSAAIWWLLIAAYWTSGTLGHLRFSDWLVTPRNIEWQGQPLTYAFKDAMPLLMPVAALGLMGWLTYAAVRQGWQKRVVIVVAYWVLWATSVVAVDRWLTFSVPEYFHYPQYATLGWLLCMAMDPHRARWPVVRVLLVTTLLGALDELAQYLWITTHYSHYYDFNDVLVNMLAGVAGVMLFYGFMSPPPKAVVPAYTRLLISRAGFAASLMCLGLFAMAFGTGAVQLTPPTEVPPGGIAQSSPGSKTLYLQRRANLYDRWHPGPWRGKHWVLGPAAGLLLTCAVALIWSGFGRTGKKTGIGAVRRNNTTRDRERPLPAQPAITRYDEHRQPD